MAPANAFDRSSIEQGKRKGEEEGEGEECEVEDEAGAVEGGADYAWVMAATDKCRFKRSIGMHKFGFTSRVAVVVPQNPRSRARWNQRQKGG